MDRLGKKLLGLILAVALLGLGAGYATAADRYVAPTGSDADNDCANPESPCATLGQAILSAESRDVLKVARGTYVENVVLRPNVTHLTLEGGWEADFSARRSDASLTVLDGDGDGTVLALQTTVANTTLNLDGFTLQNASTGIAVTNLGATVEVNIRNCRIRGNSGRGGGVMLSNNATVHIEITGCEVFDNIGLYGGVTLLNDGIATLSLTQSRISGNLSMGVEEGPIERRVELTEIDLIIDEGPTGGIGGGAGVNLVTLNGGDTDASLTQNRIEGNGGLIGGGVLIISQGSKTRALLTNNLIADNNTAFNGGGVAIWPMVRGATGDDTRVDLINNTITGNTASTAASRGGGVFVSSSDPTNSVFVILYNCIAWGNTAPSAGQDLELVGTAVQAIAAYSIIGPTRVDGADYSPLASIDADPLFADPGMGDYHLRAGSPAIGAGLYGAWINFGGDWQYGKIAPIDDFEGDLRPDLVPAECCDVQLGCDIGADQFLVLPVPADTLGWAYAAQALPVSAPGPKACRPLGVGSVAAGGDDFNWRVRLPPFSGPVDLYLAIYAPAISDDYLLVTPEGTIQGLADGGVPWRTADASGINLSLFGDVPVALLPPGDYTLFLLATAPGSLEAYYLWATSFDR
ncbi:MAG: right-handed parallel beta-helix repeat-containing protein [Desulfobacterales bacterium]|nr:right-handed parallel beta-helix repeat-containing protein [Desulfobacterales bacterium]